MDTSTIQRPVISKPKPVRVLRTKKRKTKNERQLLEIQLDVLVKTIVLERDNGCVCPPPKNGHSNVRQPGHLLSRRNKTVKWDLRNVHEQCSSCNFLHTIKPEMYTIWVLNKLGVDQYISLAKDGQEVRKYQTYELLELLEQLRKIREKQIADKEFRPYYTQAEILSGAWSDLRRE